MEVKTGEIKAIVNLSKIREGIYKEIYNYAIGKQRDPGSTFKIVSALALFEETDLQLTDTVDTGDGKHKFFDNCRMVTYIYIIIDIRYNSDIPDLFYCLFLDKSFEFYNKTIMNNNS